MEHVKESVKDNIQEIPTFPGTNLQVACSTSGVQINNIEYISLSLIRMDVQCLAKPTTNQLSGGFSWHPEKRIIGRAPMDFPL